MARCCKCGCYIPGPDDSDGWCEDCAAEEEENFDPDEFWRDYYKDDDKESDDDPTDDPS